VRKILLAMIVLGSSLVLAGQTAARRGTLLFQSARADSVGEIPVPMRTEASGTVVLDAVVTRAGNVAKVYVRRGIPALTHLAVNSVTGWKFSPATYGDNPIDSIVRVAVTFRPSGLLSSPDMLPGVEASPESESDARFQPPEVTHAAFPNYPDNTVISGSVVLEINLSANGQAEKVKVLADLPPLTAAAQAVVPQWRFSPASFSGDPVPSRIILAFVFSPFVT